jgi:hypothetical protein
LWIRVRTTVPNRSAEWQDAKATPRFVEMG